LPNPTIKKDFMSGSFFVVDEKNGIRSFILVKIKKASHC